MRWVWLMKRSTSSKLHICLYRQFSLSLYFWLSIVISIQILMFTSISRSFFFSIPLLLSLSCSEKGQLPKWGQLWKIALRQCSEAGVWSVISCWCFVEVMKLGLVNILNLKFIRDADVWSRFWGWCFVGRSEDEIWSRLLFELVIRPKEVTLVSWTQPSGPLCLWQCFFSQSSLSES